MHSIALHAAVSFAPLYSLTARSDNMFLTCLRSAAGDSALTLADVRTIKGIQDAMLSEMMDRCISIFGSALTFVGKSECFLIDDADANCFNLLLIIRKERKRKMKKIEI